MLRSWDVGHSLSVNILDFIIVLVVKTVTRCPTQAVLTMLGQSSRPLNPRAGDIQVVLVETLSETIISASVVSPFPTSQVFPETNCC